MHTEPALTLFVQELFSLLLYPLSMSDTQSLDSYWVNYLKENDVIETEDEVSKRYVSLL